MRLICPHCQVSVTLPDTAAGAPMSCPHCNQPITPPALTGAGIDAAPVPVAPPVAASRERERPEFAEKPPVAYAPGSPRGAPWFHLTIRREFAHWLAPSAVILALLLTFFTWIAVAPNGTRIYTQNCWQAAGGGFTTDLVGDRVMKAEAELKEHCRASVWLIFYLILLIPTVVIAIAGRVWTRNPATVPDVLRPVWPHRQMVVTGLCAVLLLLLVVPVTASFGLESAAAAAATPAAITAGPEPTTAEKAERDLHRDIKLAGYGLECTIWLKLAVLAQVIAVVGIGMAWWLDRHPNAPDPRLEIYC